jgi:TPR repeat protein
VPQDYAEAMKWYRMSADQSYGLAQVNIGSMYWYGRAVSQRPAIYNKTAFAEAGGLMSYGAR